MNTDLVIHGDNLSEAWARTVVTVAAAHNKHKAFHVVTRISDPTHEDDRIREMADGILAERDMAPISTVANTLFPHALAHRTPDPEALGKRYLDLLPTLQRLDHENRRGTYFERLVNYETTTGHINQLAELIRRLKQEITVRDNSTTGPKSARYEVPMEQLTANLPVSEAEHDTNPIGFPCLTLLSFQLDDDRLHVLAHYRSHYLFQRAYGNYLAVCSLLCYVCEQTGLTPGQVTIVAGYAKVDQHRKASVAVLDEYLNSDQLI
jgi:thymidylate synthase